MTFTLAPELVAIVRPAVLWLDGATVLQHDARLDAPLAAAEAAVRAHPPDETAAVRTMYKRVGIDPTKRRPSNEALLRRAFGVASAVAFDAMTLGVGDDGHTASLFPGIGAVAIDDRLVAAIAEQPAKGLEARLTLTAPVLLEARLAVVLVRGAAKRPVVEAARGPGAEDEVPSRLLQRAKGRVVWVLDREAAG